MEVKGVILLASDAGDATATEQRGEVSHQERVDPDKPGPQESAEEPFGPLP